MLNKFMNKLKKNKIDVRKLEFLVDKINYGKEGAKLLNNGQAKRKKFKEAKPLTIEILKRENRRMKLKQLWRIINPNLVKYGSWALGLAVILLLIPTVYNKVFNLPSSHVAGETSDWISFYGSYLGGLIGGFITLIGVRQTIIHSNRTLFIQYFPKKDVALRGIIIEVKKLMDKINEIENKDGVFSCLNEFSLKEIELKEKAIIVNPTTYKIIDNLFNFINEQNRIQLLLIMNKNKGVLEILKGYITILNNIKSSLFKEYEKNAGR
ncbi:hypothetical protein HGI30_04575 [Paenibacillus albicereus]|uniref:Uncharacterized protein n=1 Tax=Paenibacillus albicereus TaxID=2726185 RepID=A0A6H2GU39_9BACL|nr:hypothetical protein [Paenibacillus albicereus]QJC50905.1 hypothetical protein HGI30_04575 [Paenibacillus albicereus]